MCVLDVRARPWRRVLGALRPQEPQQQERREAKFSAVIFGLFSGLLCVALMSQRGTGGLTFPR